MAFFSFFKKRGWGIRMLSTVSLLMVLGYSIYFFLSLRSKDHEVTSSLAKCIPMILGMTSSTVIGLVMGYGMPQMLAVSTILSIVISAGIAILLGAGFGISGVIEAQASSLMGAMMGAMLGAMLSAGEIALMVMAMDVMYLVSISSMMLLMAKGSIKKQDIF